MRAATLFATVLVAVCITAATETPEQIFERASRSVVVILVSDAEGKPLALGSGVVVAAATVVTDCHVAQAGPELTVNYLQKTLSAELRYADTGRDLCELIVPNLLARAAVLGDSQSIRVGQIVYAIGAPEGLELTLSEGLVSGLRSFGFDGLRYIQTTASISPGSSGGGLFDARGRLIGITTFRVKGGENLNFALPSEWIAGLQERAAAATGAATGGSNPKSGAFPWTYIRAVQASGELPSWANYVCFDPNALLRTSYFLLVAYSPRPVEPRAAQAGVVKGATYQEYAGTQPMNVPPTSSQMEEAFAGIKAGDRVSAAVFNAMNATAQAIGNAKAQLGAATVENMMKQPGSLQYFWIWQKYTNAKSAGEPFSLGGATSQAQAQLNGGQLGWLLYETAPASNVFRTLHTADGEENGEWASLVMRPSSDALRFAFVQSVSGHTSLPVGGICDPIQHEAELGADYSSVRQDKEAGSTTTPVGAESAAVRAAMTASGTEEANWVDQALAFEEKSDWHALLRLARDWTRQEPRSSQAWARLGEAHDQLDQHDEAVNAEEEALRLDSGDEQAWRFLSGAYDDLGQLDKAFDAAQHAVRLRPDDAEAWRSLGNAYGCIGDPSEEDCNKALNAYQQAIRLKPNDTAAWFDLGYTYHKIGKQSELIATYEKLKQLDPKTAALLMQLADLP